MSWLRTHLVATVLLLTAAGLVAWLLLRSSSPGYTIRIEFADAAGLRTGGEVEEHGARVGEVSSLAVSRQDIALVTVQLGAAARPLTAGATATIRPTGLVGEGYVDLTRGSGRVLPSGATIPLSHTGQSVGFDQVLDTLDPSTRARLRILINEAGIGLLGQGSNLNQLLAALPPSLAGADALLHQVRAADAQLEDLIAHGDHVLRAVTPARDRLVALVDGARIALGAGAARHRALARTVAGAPGALVELQRSLHELAVTAVELRPAARGLTVTAAPLTRTLTQLPALARSARDALAAARSVAPTLGRLGRGATAPVNALARTAPDLDMFARGLAPVLAVMDGGGTDHLFRFVDGWAQAMSTTDSVGRMFRLDLSLSPSLLNLAVGRIARIRATNISRSRSLTSLLGYLIGP